MDSLDRLRAELLTERYGPTRARPDETPAEDSPTQIAERQRLLCEALDETHLTVLARDHHGRWVA